MQTELLKGRDLTQEERLEFEEDSYFTGGDKFLQFSFPRREDRLTAIRATTFKRDGIDMYVVEEYKDGYRINHKYINEEEFIELTKGKEGLMNINLIKDNVTK